MRVIRFIFFHFLQVFFSLFHTFFILIFVFSKICYLLHRSTHLDKLFMNLVSFRFDFGLNELDVFVVFYLFLLKFLSWLRTKNGCDGQATILFVKLRSFLFSLVKNLVKQFFAVIEILLCLLYLASFEFHLSHFSKILSPLKVVIFL